MPFSAAVNVGASSESIIKEGETWSFGIDDLSNFSVVTSVSSLSVERSRTPGESVDTDIFAGRFEICR